MEQRAAVDAPGLKTLLGVTRSIMGRHWVERATNHSEVMNIAQRVRIDEVVARLLNARGVTAEAAAGYLNPTLKADLPDPSVILDMDLAAERLADAVVAGEGIAIFGDYDVDGATSSALLAQEAVFVRGCPPNRPIDCASYGVLSRRSDSGMCSPSSRSQT